MTGVACLDVVPDEPDHAGPVVVISNKLHRLPLPRVAGHRHIVVSADDLRTQALIFGDIDLASVLSQPTRTAPQDK